MNTRVFSLLLLLAIAPAWVRAEDAERPELAPNANHIRAAKLLALNLPLRHLNREPLSERIATNALAIYLETLDFERVYFLRSDIEAFKARGPELADELRAGELAFAFQIYNILKTRVANRVAFVHELLDNGFDLNEDETYAWKRRKANWPADEEEWNELWRRKIKNEYVGHSVSRAIGGSEALEFDGEQTVTNASLAAQLRMTPEERIRRNYDRFLTLLQDNDANWVVERYMNAFARAYDPHSDYLSPWSVEDFEIGMK